MVIRDASFVPGLIHSDEACDARPGDFVAVHRVKGAGYSVVFLDWVKHDGVIVGFKYRSSQPHTDGDATESFTTSGHKSTSVNPKHIFVGRLNRS